MTTSVEVTDVMRPTRKGTGQMQAVGVDAGGAYPLESAIFIANGEQPLKPGQYKCSALRKSGLDIVLNISRNTLEPVKG